jgi:CMP-N,N'-diacetyllegionaminic acid synthase
MKILAIIPARGGSKGVPRKNLKRLGENPLLYYSYQSAKQSVFLSKTILSSEDAEIISVANGFGLEAPFVRPQNLALDTTSSIDVVLHAITFLEKKGEIFDAVCLLQPTSPFRAKGFIDEAIQTFMEKKTDALVSVLKVPQEYNPHWTFEANTDGNLVIATGEKDIIKRRQDLPDAFFRDGSVYITKVSTIKKGSFFGESLSYIESNPDFHVNIDTIEDWKAAEAKLPKILAFI